MGDAKAGPVRLSFNPQLRVEFRGATVTSDAGLLLPRELDERLGLRALIERHLTDPRTGRNRQFPLSDLFRQSIYSRLAGYEDTNDAERLSADPAFRMLASRERRETSVALTSTLNWFETDVLAEEQNYQALSRLNTDLVQREATGTPTRRVALDMDSSENPVHGAQEQSAYNGHFESVCYHPLSSSTRTVTASPPSSGQATSTALTGGTRSSSPSLIGTGPGGRPSWSEPTRRLRSRPSTRRWSGGAWHTPSASRPTPCWSGPSRISSSGRGVGPAMPRWSATKASLIRLRPGTGRGG